MPAYSLDLRIRIAQEYENFGNAERIAEMFQVGVASVYKFVKLYREGNLAPKSTNPNRLPLILDEQLNNLRDLVEEMSNRTLAQYCKLWEERKGIKVSVPVMHRAMVRAKITLTKRRNYSTR